MSVFGVGKGGGAADRTAGAVLIVAAAGTVVAMGHHPSSAHSGGLGGLVHGAMVALAAMLGFGFTQFARRRSLDRPAILAGLVAYAIGLFAHVAAATINGFVVPALAGRGAGAVGHDIFLLAWESNQALARLGVFAAGAAFILWSIDLLRRGGRATRLVGGAGLVAGAAPAILIAAGLLTMDVAGAAAVYAAHAAWSILVGVQLARGELGGGAGRSVHDEARLEREG